MDDFRLAPEDAEILRYIASVEPLEARRYLQDRPELARRMTTWPPELRLEICRILYRSFPAETRARHEARREGAGALVDLLADF